MFSYTISKKASLKEFEQICILIEATFRNIKKAEVLEDVDGSLIQIYTTFNGVRVQLKSPHRVQLKSPISAQ